MSERPLRVVDVSGGVVLFGIVSVVVWVPCFLLGAVCGWLLSAFLDGFKQARTDWRRLMDSRDWAARKVIVCSIGDKNEIAFRPYFSSDCDAGNLLVSRRGMKKLEMQTKDT